MKRTIAAIALFVASLFVTAGIWAQGVQATVPFAFTVSHKSLPAGTYTIRPTNSNPDVIDISGSDKDAHVLSLARTDSQSAKRDNVLVFHKIGGRYFLSEIRCETSAMNLYLPTSKAEKQARMQTQVASLPGGSSDVVVALY